MRAIVQKSFLDLENNIVERNNPKFIEDKESFYNQQQTLILDKFIKFQEILEPIQKLQDSINIDGNIGFGGSLLYMQEKEAQMWGINTIGISNVSSVLFESIIVQSEDILKAEFLIKKGYVKMFETDKHDTYLKPNSIPGSIFIHSLVPVNDIYKSNDTLFPYNSGFLSEMINFTLGYLSNDYFSDSVRSKVNIKKRAINLVKRFLFTTLFDGMFKNNVANENKRIRADTPKRKSFVTIMKEIKASKYDKFSKDPLLARLFFRRGTERTPATIEFNSADETTSMLFLVNGISALLLDNSVWYNKDGIVYTGMNIGLDLIRYQYLTGGIQFRKQFLKYIPFEFFESVGIADKIRNYDFNNLDYKTRQTLLDRYNTQFLQHFPKHSVNSKYFDIDSKLLTVPLKDAPIGNIIKTRYRSKELLFKFKGNDDYKKIYELINIAGNAENNVYEFDSTVDVIVSIIPYNKKYV